MEQWFGKWKGTVISSLTSLITITVAVILLGCCLMHHYTDLLQRVKEAATIKQPPTHTTTSVFFKALRKKRPRTHEWNLKKRMCNKEEGWVREEQLR